MKNRTFTTTLALCAALSLAAPTHAFDFGQKSKRTNKSHRQAKQTEWKDIGIASGVAALLGLVTKNGTVATLGTVGALYSAYRYEEDRKSSRRSDRARAELYSKSSVTIDGHKYKRQTVNRRGKKYYRFVRA